MDIHQIHQKIKELQPTWIPQNEIYKSIVSELITESSTILDIGCGRTEYMADVFSKAKKIYGQDPDRIALDENNVVDVKLYGGFEALESIINNEIDIAVSSWVLEHIDDPDGLMIALSRVLKPGGIFIALTPNANSVITRISRLIPNKFHPIIVKKFWGRELKDTYPTKYKINTKKTIQNYAKKYNFEIDQIIMLNDPSYYILNINWTAKILKIYQKFVSKNMYEGMIFIIRKPL